MSKPQTVSVNMILLPETQEKLYEIEEELQTENIVDAVSVSINLTHSLVQELRNGWKVQLVKDDQTKSLSILDDDGILDIDIEFVENEDLN